MAKEENNSFVLIGKPTPAQNLMKLDKAADEEKLSGQERRVAVIEIETAKPLILTKASKKSFGPVDTTAQEVMKKDWSKKQTAIS